MTTIKRKVAVFLTFKRKKEKVVVVAVVAKNIEPTEMDFEL